MAESIITQVGIKAYEAGRLMPSGGAVKSPSEINAAGRGFADMLEQATSDAMNSVRNADAVGQAGLTGKATTQEVVEATMAMRATVQTTTAIRDQVVRAYQEILRMPV